MEIQTRQFTSNRVVLRNETSVEHAAAEQVWTSDASFVSLGVYQQFLSMLMSLHLDLGSPAADVLGVTPDLEEQRIKALADDLEVKVPIRNTASLTSDQAWGVCYVLNGSALGASLLLKSKAVEPSWPTSYLQVMRAFARSGELAKFFRSLDAQRLDQIAAIQGARTVFQAIATWRLAH